LDLRSTSKTNLSTYHGRFSRHEESLVGVENVIISTNININDIIKN